MADTQLGSRLVLLEKMLCSLLMALSIVFILVIIFFAFLALRVDGKVDWGYGVVFIPIWILDATAFLGYLFPSESDDEDDDDDNDTEGGEGSSTGAAREERRREKRAARKCVRGWTRMVGLFNVCFLTLFQLMIVKKANDPSSIPTNLVFDPYFVLESFYFMMAFFHVGAGLIRASRGGASFVAKLGVILGGFWWVGTRVSLAILIMYRIDDKIICSWHIVFIPLYLVGVKYLVELIYYRLMFSMMPIAELRQQGYSLVNAGFCGLVVFGSLGYSLVALLAAKLDGAPYPATRVLIPVFFVLSLLLCCTGCCLPCMLFANSAVSSGSGSGTDEENPSRREGGGPQVRAVDPNSHLGASPSPRSYGATLPSPARHVTS
ncbi:hypothetical protein BGX29_010290 [Mortierella sp. GBA35]|nr:hypothetical protein BGX29_010290 [Mortierella sp. GBA35]